MVVLAVIPADVCPLFALVTLDTGTSRACPEYTWVAWMVHADEMSSGTPADASLVKVSTCTPASVRAMDAVSGVGHRDGQDFTSPQWDQIVDWSEATVCCTAGPEF
ncbi:hypothetical protein DEJ32_11415 [Curtobacterium sp. MCPF17_046]|nr:hypothetical protein DEJ32_11415 [Curtobacterium sp. MCPF17_046]